MKISEWLGFGLVVAACLPAGPCLGQSLWNQRTGPYGHIFHDTQARQVGDVVTVVIRETTDVANRDTRQYERDSNAGGGLKLNYGLAGKLGSESGSATADMSLNGKGDFDGESEYRVDRQFTDRITATVVACHPNGNLEIQGRRIQMVSGERRALVVSGIIRSLDILPDNTIESRFVANFHVCYDGDGRESRFIKEGWLTKAWNKYRPL